MTDINLFESVKQHLCSCAIDLNLASSVEAFLKMPMHELHFSVPVRMDDGTRSGRSRDTVSNIIMPAGLRKEGSGFILR